MNLNEQLSKIKLILENTKFCVIATSNKEGVVSASQVCLVSDGLKIYVQTDKTFEKVQNITENPHVAINVGPIYFKGIAKIVGHPSSNPKFVELIKNKHLSTYNQYTNLANEVLIEIEPTECRIWNASNGSKNDGQETIAVIDLKNMTQKEIVCDKM